VHPPRPPALPCLPAAAYKKKLEASEAQLTRFLLEADQKEAPPLKAAFITFNTQSECNKCLHKCPKREAVLHGVHGHSSRASTWSVACPPQAPSFPDTPPPPPPPRRRGAITCRRLCLGLCACA